MFPFENFGPYKSAITFLATISRLSADIPRGNGELLDQLKRASMSIALNIAEGCGRTSKSDAKRFYSIARGSAMESAAILDVLWSLKLVDDETRRDAKAPLLSITAILTSICRPK